MTVKITVTEIGDDGTEVPLDAELAAALAGPVRRDLAGILAWTAREAAPLDHGERETAIAGSGMGAAAAGAGGDVRCRFRP